MIRHNSSTLIPVRICGFDPGDLTLGKGTGGDEVSSVSKVQGGCLSNV